MRGSLRGLSELMIAVALTAGCGGGCGASTAAPAGPSEANEGSRGESPGGAAARGAEAEEESEPEPAPTARLGARADARGQVVIELENRGTETARFASTLTLERRAENGFEPEPSATLSLRPDCERAAPECVELAPGAVFIPPPWLASLGDAQCVCERCVPAPPGTYRFVAQSCGGQHRIEGDDFDLP